MQQRTIRLELYELVWSSPLTAAAPRFEISDVALKNTCRRFDIPVPPRGYWAKLQAGKPTNKVALPARAAGMDDEVVVGGRNHYWYNQLTDEQILGPLPEPPSFPEDIALVRDRVRKLIGKVSVPKALMAKHPAIARLIEQDNIRRQKQLTTTYTFSWDKPVFESPFEQRRLRFLNAVFLAAARCGGKPQVGGRKGREISIVVHQNSMARSLDRSPAGRHKRAGGVGSGPDQLRFAILTGYDVEERTAWQDGAGGPLEHFVQEVAVEIVTTAEIVYRERCVRGFEWRVRRKAQLEEHARNYQLQLEREREERERQQRLEQARIDRLLDDAASLRRASDIRAYVEAVRITVANDVVSISQEAVARWSKWALAEADRIDPVKTARFLDEVEVDDDGK